MSSVINFYNKERKLIKPVDSQSAVNVLYFTNKCNLACTYCYEDLPGRPPQILSREQIQSSIDSILAREHPDNQTLIVLFGGEATLEWENVCFAMDYAYSHKQFIHFNLSTNGIKFLSQKFLDEVKNNPHHLHKRMSIDISFDGVGNKDRVFHNGKESTNEMLQVLTNLIKNNIKFRLRYTIQKNNIDIWAKDILQLAKTFKPSRIITSVAWATLSPEDHEKLTVGKNLLRTEWINKTIGIPVCEFFCDMCNGCDVTKETKTYFTDEGNVTTYAIDENAPLFNDFKRKENT